MTNIKPTKIINRTYCTAAVEGFFIISMLASGNYASTIDRNYLGIVEEKNSQFNGVELLNAYRSEDGISCSLRGYNIGENSYSDRENVIINEEKMYNLKKIDQIALLKDDWNGNKAQGFSEELLSEVRKVITSLDIQPELFPTACDSIQLEYEKEDGSYLEIEIVLKDKWKVFEIDNKGEEVYFSIPADISSINKVVNGFYE